MKIYLINKLDASIKTAISICVLLFCGQSFSGENTGSKTILDLHGLTMKVELHKKSLVFIVRNDQDKDLLVADDFCFDSKSQNILLDESNLKVRKDNFSNGIARMQGRMAKLKSHGERTCEIAYFDNAEKNVATKANGLILWHTNLFVGDFQGSYASKRFTGIIPISFPVGGNSLDSKPEVDDVSLSSYKLRKSLGIIED